MVLHCLEQDLELPGHACDRFFIEERRPVLERAQEAVPPVDEFEREVDLSGARRNSGQQAGRGETARLLQPFLFVRP